MPLRECPENLDEDLHVGRPGRADGQLTDFALSNNHGEHEGIRLR